MHGDPALRGKVDQRDVAARGLGAPVDEGRAGIAGHHLALAHVGGNVQVNVGRVKKPEPPRRTHALRPASSASQAAGSLKVLTRAGNDVDPREDPTEG
jgi:hypothetical protein